MPSGQGPEEETLESDLFGSPNWAFWTLQAEGGPNKLSGLFWPEFPHLANGKWAERWEVPMIKSTIYDLHKSRESTRIQKAEPATVLFCPHHGKFPCSDVLLA